MSSRKPTVVGVSIALPIIATLSLALRYHARRVKKARLEIDDYLLLVALILCYGLSATTLAGVYMGGLGDHLELGPGGIPVHPEKFITSAQASWVLRLICIPAMGLTKLSVLFFYKKIFTPRSFRIAAWVMILLVVGWNIACFLVNLLNCLPIEVSWRPSTGGSARCLDITKIFWGVVLTDIFTDVIILMMPWPQIWKLQMSTTRKSQLGALFMLGSFVVGAGIARTVLSAPGVVSNDTDLDYTYSRAPAVYWTIIEANVGVISACLPTMRPLLANLKFADIGSSLRKAFYGSRRTNDTVDPDATITPWSGDDDLHLVDSRKRTANYAKASMSQTWAVPLQQMSPKNGMPGSDGITVQREFSTHNQPATAASRFEH